jgi:hypothetical protein
MSTRKQPPRAMELKPETTRQDVAVAGPPEQPEPSRRRAQPYSVSVVSAEGEALKIASDDPEARKAAFGTGSLDFATMAFGRLGAIARRRGAELPTEGEINAALAAVDGLQPRDEVEAMLAVQMYATHEVAMEMLTRAKMSSAAPVLQNCSSIAIKLLRTYTAQIEALAKLRRGGEQTVRVEHVHVHSGGQAIVGSVTRRGPGGGGATYETRGQAHETDDARALAVAPGSPMWGEEPEG